jgi:hypothetical protein
VIVQILLKLYGVHDASLHRPTVIILIPYCVSIS